jgi:hypothetical protein
LSDLEELLNEAEWRKCKGSGPADYDAALYFLTSYWKIQHPERGAILFEMRDAQVSTLETWMSERMSIVLKARQIGFSTLVIGLAFWITFFHDEKFVIGLSKTEREAMKLLKKGLFGYKRLPVWMLERGPEEVSKTLTKLEFGNGSSIEVFPASDPARGESAFLIIVDEWAFFPDPEAAWSAIEPAADIGGRIIALSTANGVGNLYYEMVMGAQTGSNDFEFIFHSWRAVPERDDAWYASKVRSMQPATLHQEYPTTAEEAFIKSGNPVFDIEMLDGIPTEPPLRRGFLARTPAVQLMADEHGPLQVWELPVAGKRYVGGADVAEGLEHGDYSVAHIIRHDTGKVVAKWRGHIAPDLFGRQVLAGMGRFYNKAFLGVEVNNHGYATLVALRDEGYPNIYHRSSYDEAFNKSQRKMGWRTQVNTKPLAIDALGEALREEDIVLLDKETIGELRTFRRVQTGEGSVKMSGQPFDDQTMSLAIANMMRQHVAQAVWAADSGPAWNTLDGIYAEMAMAPRSVLRIGGGNVRSGR